MEVIEIKPIGYCLGVIQAINVALKTRKDNPNSPIYVFGLLVHNDEVTKMLEKENIQTIDITKINVKERLNQFTQDDIVIFTAHGHPSFYEEILIKNGVRFIDTTCSRVKKNMDLMKEASKNHEVIFIGKAHHPETIAALSIADNIVFYVLGEEFDYSIMEDVEPLVVNQTTLSFLELEDIHKDILDHLPKAHIYDEICNATRVRQEGLLKMDDSVDLVIIIGSNISSNTTKLYEISKAKLKQEVIMINSFKELENIDLSKVNKVALASGTSASIQTIKEIKDYLRSI